MHKYKIGNIAILLNTFGLTGAVKNKRYKIIGTNNELGEWYLLSIKGGNKHAVGEGWWYPPTALEPIIIGEQLEFDFMYDD